MDKPFQRPEYSFHVTALDELCVSIMSMIFSFKANSMIWWLCAASIGHIWTGIVNFFYFFLDAPGLQLSLTGSWDANLGFCSLAGELRTGLEPFSEIGFVYQQRSSWVYKDVKECQSMRHFLADEVVSALETASQGSVSVSVLQEKEGKKKPNILTNIPLNFPQSVQSFIQFETKVGSCWRI